jgi:Lrp/AsnC family transcriptional regulator, leucine-responsive regulatory protein
MSAQNATTLRREPVQLDDVDLELLTALQEDASVTNVELARRAGLSPAASLRRVQRLKDTGVVAGIVARLDAQAAGFPLRVFVQLTLGRHTDAAEAKLAQTIRGLPQVVSATWVAGETDVLCDVVARDLEELQSVLVALSSRGGAQRVVTLLRLRELKAPSPLPVSPAATPRRARRARPG